MREIDQLTVQNHKVSSLQLMESAAAACLKAISNHFDGELADKKIQILCGPGNNGGDGAALARQLASQRVQTDVILFGSISDTTGDARHNSETLAELKLSGQSLPINFIECHDPENWTQLARDASVYDVIVDALFGTGLKDDWPASSRTW